MIISHKYKFIFVKTAKTAGTSIELYFDPICGEDDIFTPFSMPEPGYHPRNYSGMFNPLPEVLKKLMIRRITEPVSFTYSWGDFFRKRRYFHHIPAWLIKKRVPRRIWDEYYKFCVERNPFDKVISGWFWYNYKRKTQLTLDEYIASCARRIEARIYGVGTCPYNYYNYSDPVTGTQIVDKIIYYENLVPGLNHVFADLGIGAIDKLDIHTKSGLRDQRHYRDIITSSQKDRIEVLFKEEIKLHGYKF